MGQSVVAAVVVFYHPNPVVLSRLLTSLSGQVDKVVAVDNTPELQTPPVAFFERFPYPVSYIHLGSNKGIAEAQNIGIQEAINTGSTHVLLLDQDSMLLPDMVTKLIAAEAGLLKMGVNVAAVGPQFIDEKTGTASRAIHRGFLIVRKIRLDRSSSEPVETDNLIASGSIIRTSAMRSVGMMRDDLFIEFVDTEWCLRAQSLGHKSYCVPSAVMMHSTGDAALRICGKEIYVHNNLRRYYKLRNAIYLMGLPSMGWRWRSYTLRWIPYYFLVSLIISPHKFRSARLFLKALWDGFLGRLGPAPSALGELNYEQL